MAKIRMPGSGGGRGGAVDAQRNTLWTTPWSWRDSDGTYVGYNKEVWVYREIIPQPMEWEDPNTRLARGRTLHNLLVELGATSRDIAGGIAALAQKREIHLLAITYEDLVETPDTATDDLREYIEASLDFPVPQKVVLIGVKLRSSASDSMSKAKGAKGWLRAAQDIATSALGEGVPDLGAYAGDRDTIEEVLRRNGGRAPSREALRQLESWFNNGRGPDVELIDTREVLYADGGLERIEMAALMGFDEPIMESPGAQWLSDAFIHSDGPCIVSVRGALEPTTVARQRARRSQRKMLAQLEEEAATQDLGREETGTTLRLAEELESFLVNAREPLLSNVSFIFGRRVREADETYIDELRNVHGIRVKALEHRQLAALDETLPCSATRVNPFVQDINPAMLAYAGLSAFSNIGDGSGLYLGLADPDYTPAFIDPLGAPARNLPPAMAIFGDPGSGKTFTGQHLASQCAMAGLRVFFVNPKAYDGGLGGMADMVGGEVVRMSEMEGLRGVFDPFRFAPSTVMAAEIASGFILGVLGSRGSGVGFTQAQELALGSGLKRGALGGARSVDDALEFVLDEDVKKQVRQMVETSSLFALGVGSGQVPAIPVGAGLTLIEFDRKLPLPEKGVSPRDYTTEQRVALAAIRLTTRMCLETLVKAGGGAFLLDEAWTFLNSSEGLATVQQMGREGRSMNILPIFITQRVNDLVREGVDMEGYLSRVLVMKLNDDREAEAALQLCGLEPTAARINWLKNAGPRKSEPGMPGRPALSLFRDLQGRHSAVLIGPVPPSASEAFTTNPLERAAAKQKAAQTLADAQAVTDSSQHGADVGPVESSASQTSVPDGWARPE
jgi:hypothetical protein